MLERQESGKSSLDEAYEAGLAALHKDNDWHKPDGRRPDGVHPIVGVGTRAWAALIAASVKETV